MNIKWLCLISGGLLLIAIPTGWPYDFYILLRWAIFASSIIVAYGFYKSELTPWAFVFGGIAYLFNPIIPVYLSRQMWTPIDLITGFTYFLAAYSVKDNKKG